MSTHNCVTRTGEGCFLELIAIDADAPEPPRPRWFTLDEPETRARLAERTQSLCWVVRTDDLDGVLAASPVELGTVTPLRRGDLTWRITIPDDGSFAEGGLVPSFIEWSPGPHPSAGMVDLGLRIERITLTHPDPEYLIGILIALKVAHLAAVVGGARAGIAFQVRTRDGGLVEF